MAVFGLEGVLLCNDCTFHDRSTTPHRSRPVKMDNAAAPVPISRYPRHVKSALSHASRGKFEQQ